MLEFIKMARRGGRSMSTGALLEASTAAKAGAKSAPGSRPGTASGRPSSASSRPTTGTEGARAGQSASTLKLEGPKLAPSKSAGNIPAFPSRGSGGLQEGRARPQSAAGSRPGKGKKAPPNDALSDFRERLEQLVESGQSLDYCEKPFYRPALWEATWRGQEEIVKLLASKRASLCVADYEGRTPLHEAAYFGRISLVEFFLEGNHPIDCADHFGQTPLFRAVDNGRWEVAELLIRKRAQVGLLDKTRVTVQHLAAFRGCPDAAWRLFYLGSHPRRFDLEEQTRHERVQQAYREAEAAAAALRPRRRRSIPRAAWGATEAAPLQMGPRLTAPQASERKDAEIPPVSSSRSLFATASSASLPACVSAPSLPFLNSEPELLPEWRCCRRPPKRRGRIRSSWRRWLRSLALMCCSRPLTTYGLTKTSY